MFSTLLKYVEKKSSMRGKFSTCFASVNSHRSQQQLALINASHSASHQSKLLSAEEFPKPADPRKTQFPFSSTSSESSSRIQRETSSWNVSELLASTLLLRKRLTADTVKGNAPWQPEDKSSKQREDVAFQYGYNS